MQIYTKAFMIESNLDKTYLSLIWTIMASVVWNKTTVWSSAAALLKNKQQFMFSVFLLNAQRSG